MLVTHLNMSSSAAPSSHSHRAAPYAGFGNTRYLVRLDDACPTMDAAKWDAIESVLTEFNVKPIVSVIPSNQDPKFMASAPDPHFWNKVHRWKKMGWCIGLHGHTHIYQTSSKSLVPINPRSEFAGLPLAAQQEKIRSAWEVFVHHGIQPDVWVAPGHSFDANTLEALRRETPLRIVSDGIALAPYNELGFHWLPQQLWRFRWMPFGLYTVCLHPEYEGPDAVPRLRSQLESFHRQVVSFHDVDLPSTPKTLLDKAFAGLFFPALRGKTWLRSIHRNLVRPRPRP
jgi:predicted deacetylase